MKILREPSLITALSEWLGVDDQEIDCSMGAMSHTK